MKKITILAVLLATAVSATFAQSNPPQFIGLQLGFAEPITRLNAPIQTDVTKLSTTTIYNGLKVGFVYDATLVKGFGFSMALNYTFGAGSTDWTQKYTGLIYPKTRTRSFYHQIELPVDWQYKFEIAKRTWLILYTGPTIQCGLAMQGKEYTQDDSGTTTQTAVINYYNAEPYSKDANPEGAGDRALKRMNVTWGVGAGFQYDRYFIRGGYDFGIINPYHAQSFSDQDIYTRGRFDQWQIKLGIYLWEF